MKRLMKIISRMRAAALSVLVLFPGMAWANNPFTSTPIVNLTLHDWGNQVLIELPAPLSVNEGCANNSTLVVEKTHPFFREIYAAVLAARVSGKNIRGWVNGCNSTFNAPILTRLDL